MPTRVTRVDEAVAADRFQRLAKRPKHKARLGERRGAQHVLPARHDSTGRPASCSWCKDERCQCALAVASRNRSAQPCRSPARTPERETAAGRVEAQSRRNLTGKMTPLRRQDPLIGWEVPYFGDTGGPARACPRARSLDAASLSGNEVEGAVVGRSSCIQCCFSTRVCAGGVFGSSPALPIAHDARERSSRSSPVRADRSGGVFGPVRVQGRAPGMAQDRHWGRRAGLRTDRTARAPSRGISGPQTGLQRVDARP